jgi:hypothetical protein
MTCVTVFDNDGLPPSTHSIVNFFAPGPRVEGNQFCWTVVLDSPVSGAPLTITGTLSGAEQAARGYPAPTAVIGIGQTSAQLCVQTFDDTDEELDLSLCVTIPAGGRITAGAGPACTTVQDNDTVVWLPEDSLMSSSGTCIAFNCAPPQPNITSEYVNLSPDGSLTSNMQTGPLTWFSGATVNPFDYEVRVIGALISGPSPTNTWLNLGAARSFVRNVGCAQNVLINGNLQIRRVSDLAIVVDQNYGGYRIVTGVNAQCP